jgi:transposase-like protein
MMASPQRWKCPDCGSTFVTYVKLLEPPTCKNPDRHSSRTIEMQPQGEKK